jgi:hypothetical protein
MSNTVILSQTVIVDGTVIADAPEGVFADIDFPNPKTARVNGQNGATISETSNGKIANIIVYAMQYSDSDEFLNNLMNESPRRFIEGRISSQIQRNGEEKTDSIEFQAGAIVNENTITLNNTDGATVARQYTIQALATREV